MARSAATSRPRWASLLLLAVASASNRAGVVAFAPLRPASSRPVTSLSMSTVAPPPPKTDRWTETETDRRTRTGGNDDSVDDITIYREGPLEYLEDESESREPDDPFHILLLAATFDKPRITVPYVAGSVSYVLDMPEEESDELTRFAKDNGFSCLGTWAREECLSLGRQLQVRDIVCRVVPYCEGGARGWQAKDAGSAGAGASSGGDFGGFQ